jgi:hypothetical protein
MGWIETVDGPVWESELAEGMGSECSHTYGVRRYITDYYNERTGIPSLRESPALCGRCEKPLSEDEYARALAATRGKK